MWVLYANSESYVQQKISLRILTGSKLCGDSLENKVTALVCKIPYTPFPVQDSKRLTFLFVALQSFCWNSFLILYTFGRIPWTGDQSATRLLLTYRTTQMHNKGKQTPMPWVRFEPTIPAFESGPEQRLTSWLPDMTSAEIEMATSVISNRHNVISVHVEGCVGPGEPGWGTPAWMRRSLDWKSQFITEKDQLGENCVSYVLNEAKYWRK
jgi:hypothetical protein